MARRVRPAPFFPGIQSHESIGSFAGEEKDSWYQLVMDDSRWLGVKEQSIFKYDLRYDLSRGCTECGWGKDKIGRA